MASSAPQQKAASKQASGIHHRFLFGQLSLETLVIFLLFLTILGISYTAASRLSASTQAATRIALAKSSFAEFSSALSEACSLGNGNVRLVKIREGEAAVSQKGGGYLFSSGAFSAEANSSCEILVLQEEPSANFRIENLEGKIRVS
jgi:hypothetical protein